MSTAPQIRTSETATSATTIVRRTPSRDDEPRRGQVQRLRQPAGRHLQRRQQADQRARRRRRAAAKPSTRGSSATDAVDGSDGAISGDRGLDEQVGEADAGQAAERQSTRLSVSTCATSRPRLAPSAARTAISCRRATPLARSRLAMFAEAISRTITTAPNATKIDWRRRAGDEILIERIDRHAPVAFERRLERRQARADRAHLLARLVQAHAAPEPADGAEPVVAARELIRREHDRLPEAGVLAIEAAGRQNADDLVRLAVEHDVAVRGSPGSPPKRACQAAWLSTTTGLAPGSILAGEERAAERGLHAEHLEVVGRHQRARQPRRIARARSARRSARAWPTAPRTTCSAASSRRS